tara:strand:+ start:123 stop:899 length:777 start_codon:yes stop_codon:yes gene_type:complete
MVLPQNIFNYYNIWKNNVKNLNSDAVFALDSKGIPLSFAIDYGIGFKNSDSIILPINKQNLSYFDYSFIIVPHTNLKEEVVNFHAYPVQESDSVNQFCLTMQKGIFNAKALNTYKEPLYICEDIFDALSLFSIGISRVVAVFDLSEFRWDWIQTNEDCIILAFNKNKIEIINLLNFISKATLKGLTIFSLDPIKTDEEKTLREAYLDGRDGKSEGISSYFELKEITKENLDIFFKINNKQLILNHKNMLNKIYENIKN